MVDEFFSTVPGLIFDMCIIVHLSLRHICPSEFTLHLVKRYSLLIDLPSNLFYSTFAFSLTMNTPTAG